MINKIIWLLKELDYLSKFLLLTVVIVFMSFLEALGIAIIFPMVTTLLDENFYNSLSANIYETLYSFGIVSNQDFLIMILALIGCLYALKTLISMLAINFQFSIIYAFQREVALKVLSNILDIQDVEVTNEESAAKLTNTIHTEVALLSSVIANYINIIVDILMSSFVLITVIVIGSFYSIGMFAAIGLTAYLILKLSSSRLEYFGKIRQKFEANRLKVIGEGILGMREIKLFGFFRWFESNFNKINVAALNARKKEAVIKSYPRHLLEFAIIVALVLFIFIWLMFSGLGTSSLIPVITLFAAASFKILPAANRITTSIQAINFYGASVNTIFDLVRKTYSDVKSNQPINLIENINSIELEEMSFKYSSSKNILEKINFKLEKNQKIAVIGKSGSGKSTFINLLCGLLQKTNGKYLINGNEVDYSIYQKALFNACAYVSQKPFLFNSSLAKNISCFEENINMSKIKKILEIVKLGELTESPEEFLISENQNNLSGGQIQRIGFARALYSDAQIFVLDEPTSSLDKENTKIINEIIYGLNATIIWISHEEASVQNCDKIFRIENGNMKEVL